MHYQKCIQLLSEVPMEQWGMAGEEAFDTGPDSLKALSNSQTPAYAAISQSSTLNMLMRSLALCTPQCVCNLVFQASRFKDRVEDLNLKTSDQWEEDQVFKNIAPRVN